MTASEIPTGAGNTKTNATPKGSIQIKNDYASRGFDDACPPVGHDAHIYRFTVHALSVAKLELAEDASGSINRLYDKC